MAQIIDLDAARDRYCDKLIIHALARDFGSAAAVSVAGEAQATGKTARAILTEIIEGSRDLPYTRQLSLFGDDAA